MASPEEVLILARLAGTREFLANAEAMGVAVEDLGLKTDLAGAAMERTTRRGYLMNQALFTVRRLVYGVTLAFVGSAVAAVKWGFDFNSSMQQARVALGPVSDSIGGVDERLRSLFQLTKYTPFQFKDVTIAFRQMYFGMRTLGISADTVQTTLKSIIDSLSATGRTSPGALNRVAVALQHMAYQGFLTGQAVNQLNRDGIPATAILAKEFGLTGDQIHNIRAQGIPTLEFLRRMNHYIETQPGLANAAQRQAVHSLHGLFTTFRDNMAQLMGAIEKGFFQHLQNRIQQMNGWFDRTSETIRATGNNAAAVVNAIDPAALPLWRQLAADVHLLWVNFSNVVGAILSSRMVWATLYLALVLVHGVLLLLVPLTANFKTVLIVLVPLVVALWTATKLWSIWTAIAAFEEAVMTKATKDLTFAQFLMTVAMGEYAIGAKIAVAASYAYETVLYLLYAAQYQMAEGSILARTATYLWTAAVWLAYAAQWALMVAINVVKDSVIAQRIWTIATTAASYLWITAIYAASVAQGVLAAAMRSEAIAAALAWAATLGPITLIVAGIVGIGVAILLVIKYWEQLRSSMSGGWIRKSLGIPAGAGGGGHFTGGGIAGNWLSAHGVPGWLTGAHRVPGMAVGGTVQSAGFAWVGERGPELVALPGGATVTPARESPGVFNLMESWMRNGQEKRGPIVVKVQIGRKVIAQAVAEEMAAQGARA